MVLFISISSLVSFLPFPSFWFLLPGSLVFLPSSWLVASLFLVLVPSLSLLVSFLCFTAYCVIFGWFGGGLGILFLLLGITSFPFLLGWTTGLALAGSSWFVVGLLAMVWFLGFRWAMFGCMVLGCGV